MPWFVEVTHDNRNRPNRLGPFETEEEATANKDAFLANSQDPNPAAGEPFYLELGDPNFDAPVVKSINVDKDGNEIQVWTDGSTSAVGEV